MMKDNEYKCAVCKGVFEKTWTDEEAKEEMKANFGEDHKPDSTEVVCDVCYNSLMSTLKN